MAGVPRLERAPGVGLRVVAATAAGEDQAATGRPRITPPPADVEAGASATHTQPPAPAP
jgi:hypothetical protein